ncbi:MAG: NFACT family protein, partial [Candidatus Aenigmarchaeota archaeon]|nr:NFACT family protein [Candidatus Aenigmarchaeota archaeon]
MKIKRVKQIPFGFLFEFFRSKTKLIITSKYFFVTSKNYEAIANTNFCNFIKSKLTGEKIIDVYQKDFDRIVEIKTENYFLVLEFFGKGNIILTNSEKIILNALELREWRDRKIKKGVKYEYPPTTHKNPFSIDIQELRSMVDEKEIGRILSKDLGFGGEFAK